MQAFTARLRNTLGDRAFFMQFIRLMIPIAVSSILSSSLQITDTLMMAQLSNEQVAAVGLANRLSFLMQFIFYGIGSGAAIFTAQFWGARDLRGIRRVMGTALLLCVPVSLLFFTVGRFFPGAVMRLFSKDAGVIEIGVGYLRVLAFAYPFQALVQVFGCVLRSVERPKLSMVSSTVAIGLNILLNAVLIFGLLGFPALGARGAAMATVIAAILDALVLIVFSNVIRTPVRLRPGDLMAPTKPLLKQFLRKIFPVLCNEIFWALGTITYTYVYASMGTAQAAAATVYKTIEQLIVVSCISVGTAGGVMVGIELGRGNLAQAQTVSERVLLIGFILAVLLCPVLLLLRGPVLSLYQNLTPEVTGYVYGMLGVLSCCLWIKMGAFGIINGILRAGGDTAAAAMIDVGSQWAIAVPLVCLGGLVFKWPLVTVFSLVFIEEAHKLAWCIWRYRRGAWRKRLSAGEETSAAT